MTEGSKNTESISEDLKELVIYRLDILPSDKKISIGSSGDYSKSELIEHVKNEDEIGQKVVELEMTFLKALKNGVLLDEILPSSQ